MSEQNQGAPAPEASATPAEQSQEQASEEVEGQEAEASESEGGEEAVAEENKELADLSKKEQKKLSNELKRKFKLKVDGKDVEEEVDFNDEEGMIKRLQLGKAAQKRMQEATELRKAAEEFITMLKTDPRRVLSDPNIGVDLKALAQQVMNEEIENAAKSPEQLQIEKLQKELEGIKGTKDKEEKERKEREFTRLQAEQEEKIQNDIESALGTNELPKTPYTVRKMAELMMTALQNDIDLSPKDLVPLLRKQMTSDIKELFGASSDDVLEEMIGKERISSLRKKNVAKVKSQQIAQTASSVKATAQPAKESEKKNEKISMKDFLRGKI